MASFATEKFFDKIAAKISSAEFETDLRHKISHKFAANSSQRSLSKPIYRSFLSFASFVCSFMPKPTATTFAHWHSLFATHPLLADVRRSSSLFEFAPSTTSFLLDQDRKKQRKLARFEGNFLPFARFLSQIP
ncbi:hypothetical protein MA16_Dca028930 [Dendrobium catenatum]|uniref:Uncharacterized protein n=1 Tax=Dendrobium catenatum TaxID=906689 RepID=A0A2I0V6J5_9ASPA|nr:hypothetical protein MA16_Dca028930 [Dendrobium catenatum]